MGSGGFQLNQCEQCGSARSDLADGLCPVCIDANMATIFPNVTPDHGADRTIAPGGQQAGGVQQSARIGDYDLIEEIARGGMGVVYKANHRNLNRISAVKMILGGRFSSEEERQRFHIEAESAARLDHSAIVPIYEIGDHEGQPFFAMKFVDGGSLAEKATEFVNKPHEAAKLMIEVAKGVHHAHQRGVLHRDLKPANILLDSEGQPFVTDLGLAKSTSGGSDLTQTGAVLGTPTYMPPEQAAGKSVTTAADVYSLGAILYELIVGKPPYLGSTTVDVVMQVIDAPPPTPRSVNPEVERDLELIILKCLKREPGDRYSSAQELANDLQAWSSGDAISVKPPSFRALVGSWLKQNQQVAYAMFALTLGFLLCAPPAISFFSDTFSEIYQRFPDNELPLIYRIKFPQWLAVASTIMLFLVIWPSIGFLNAIVSRQKTIRGSFVSGLGLAAVLSLVFYLLLGWLVFLQGATMKTRSNVKVLAHAVWPNNETSKEDALEKANQLFGGVDAIPLEERAALVQGRINADLYASATGSFRTCLFVVVVFAIPIIFGTVIGFLLRQRPLPAWLFAIRYLVAWWSLTIASVGTTMAISSFFTTAINLQSNWWQIVLACGVCFLIAWLTLRRWKQPVSNAMVETVA